MAVTIRLAVQTAPLVGWDLHVKILVLTAYKFQWTAVTASAIHVTQVVDAPVNALVQESAAMAYVSVIMQVEEEEKFVKSQVVQG